MGYGEKEKPGARRSRFLRGALVFTLLAALTLAAYPTHNFGSGLSRDSAIYLYSGQQLLEGVPPYVSIFDHKGPLAPLISGLGVLVSEILGTSELVTVRTVFLAFGCLAITAVYFLSRHLLGSLRGALFATITFIGFFSFARYAVAEPEAKTPMLLFQTLALLFTVQKRWFLAGLCGSLTMLIWQPMAVFALITILLATARPGEAGRRSAVGRAVGGAAAPVAAVVVCFYLWGALYELNGAILFNLRYLDQEQLSLVSEILRAAKAIFVGYSSVLVPVVIASMVAMVLVGFAAVIRLYVVRIHRIVADGSSARELLDSRFAPLLLSLPFPVAWSLLDFQGYPDFYVFLPYIAVGFGGSLDFVIRRASLLSLRLSPGAARRALSAGACAALAAIAIIGSMIVVSPARQASSLTVQQHGISPTDIEDQRQAAREIEDRFGEDARIVSIGVPQLLVLLQETNPNPYAFVVRGIDQEIAETTPGGFDGWLRQIQSHDPDVIALGPTTGEHEAMLLDWLNENYEREQIGPWTLYVEPDQARKTTQDQQPPDTDRAPWENSSPLLQD